MSKMWTPNIYVQKKQMSEYISKRKIGETNVQINIRDQYIQIFKYIRDKYIQIFKYIRHNTLWSEYSMTLCH